MDDKWGTPKTVETVELAHPVPGGTPVFEPCWMMLVPLQLPRGPISIDDGSYDFRHN